MDLGCGFGTSSLGLVSADASLRVLAVDASAQCVAYARGVAARWRLPPERLQVDGRTIPECSEVRLFSSCPPELPSRVVVSTACQARMDRGGLGSAQRDPNPSQRTSREASSANAGIFHRIVVSPWPPKRRGGLGLAQRGPSPWNEAGVRLRSSQHPSQIRDRTDIPSSVADNPWGRAPQARGGLGQAEPDGLGAPCRRNRYSSNLGRRQADSLRIFLHGPEVGRSSLGRHGAPTLVRLPMCKVSTVAGGQKLRVVCESRWFILAYTSLASPWISAHLLA